MAPALRQGGQFSSGTGGPVFRRRLQLRYQGVILIHVLHRHPTLLTTSDLVREITSGSEDFAETDAVERAVRDLNGVGLLHRSSRLVVPSPAALRFLKIICENGA